MLYNLVDLFFYGYGVFFINVCDVVNYFNEVDLQNVCVFGNVFVVDFVLFGLMEEEILDIIIFFISGLCDLELSCYELVFLLSGNCFFNNDDCFR